MLDQVGFIHDRLHDHDILIRDLLRRVEAVMVGDSIRSDSIDGIIPAANAPVWWSANGNLLGGGTRVDILEHARVWISGSFVAGRAFYDVGSYPQTFDGFGWVWVSGAFVPGDYDIGTYPLPFISGVSFALNGDPLCYGAGFDLQESDLIWISGSCVGGRASYVVGSYGGGGAGVSGAVAWYVDDDHFCDALEAELVAGTGVWISGTCEGGVHARFEIGVYSGGAGGGDDILALTYAVAF